MRMSARQLWDCWQLQLCIPPLQPNYGYGTAMCAWSAWGVHLPTVQRPGQGGPHLLASVCRQVRRRLLGKPAQLKMALEAWASQGKAGLSWSDDIRPPALWLLSHIILNRANVAAEHQLD